MKKAAEAYPGFPTCRHIKTEGDLMLKWKSPQHG